MQSGMTDEPGGGGAQGVIAEGEASPCRAGSVCVIAGRSVETVCCPSASNLSVSLTLLYLSHSIPC
jgi:hypothetical protein